MHSLGGETLVAEELGAHTLGGHLAETLGLLDTVAVSLAVLVVVGVVLGFCHFEKRCSEKEI